MLKKIDSLFLIGFIIFISMKMSFADTSLPKKSIRLVVPVGIGGLTDVIARIIADKTFETLNQQIIIDNRAGAGGIIGSEIVAKAQPDGNTLLMAFPAHTINPSLYKKLPYHTIEDFSPITMATSVTEILLVQPTSPVHNLQDLINAAKENPGQLNYGSVGVGSLAYLASELLASMTGIRVTHIAYKSGPQAQIALASGEIQFYFGVPLTSIATVRSGRLRAIAVSSKSRISALPQVPTMMESGLTHYEVIGWNGILAPAKIKSATVNRLHLAFIQALKSPDIIEKLSAQGAESIGNSPKEFAQIIHSDILKWSSLMKASKISYQQ